MRLACYNVLVAGRCNRSDSECIYSHDPKIINEAKTQCMAWWKAGQKTPFSNLSVLDRYFPNKMEWMTQRATRTTPGNPSINTSIPWRKQLPILVTRIAVPVRTLIQASRIGPSLQRFPKLGQPSQLSPPTILAMIRTNLCLRQIPAPTYD